MPQIESWFKVTCPECNTGNWVYNGDPTDMTFFESENIQCWKCKHCMSMNEDSDEIDPDECEVGLRIPQ